MKRLVIVLLSTILLGYATPSFAATTPPESNLFYGISGAAVSDLQYLLHGFGYFTGEVTGNFFSKTARAVKKLQDALGITPTGYYGPKTRSALLSSGMLAAAATYTTTGPAAFYSFDESSGNALDESGNGATATLTGVTRTAGKSGNAISFTAAGQKVEALTSPQTAINGSFTLEAWINPTSLPTTYEPIIIKAAGYPSDYSLYLIQGQLMWKWAGSSGYFYSSTIIQPNIWQHIAIVYNASAKTWTYYINGVLSGTGAESGAPTGIDGPLYIGSTDNTTDVFPGAIDEVRIYARALTSSEVQADMNAASGGTAQVSVSPPSPQPVAPPPAPVSAPAPAPTPSLTSSPTLSPASVSIPLSIPSGSLPTWVQRLPLWQWYAIPNTPLSSVEPVVRPLGITGPSSKITTWTGATLRRNGSVYMLGAAGGHGDYAGNEVDAITLNSENPKWVELHSPSANADIVNAVQFYLDSRPSATHTYYATQFIESKNRMFVMSSSGLGGPFPPAPAAWSALYAGNTRSFSFNLSTNEWDSPDYVAAYTGGGDWIAGMTAKNPVTDDIYMERDGASGWWKWTAATNSWTKTGSVWDGSGAGYAGAAIDPTRSRMLIVGDYGGTVLPRVRDLSGALILATFTGLGANSLAMSGYPGVVYDEVNDTYLVFKNETGGIGVYRVNAGNFTVDTPTITGTLPTSRTNGIQNSVQYVPELGGVVIANSYTGNIQFMRTSLTPSTLVLGSTPTQNVLPSPATVSTKFSLNSRIQVSNGPLNVRATTDVTSALLGTQATGALGTVIGGPVAQGGYNWWNVNFDTGVRGWVVEDFLSMYTPQSLPPSTPSPVTPTVSSAPPPVGTRITFFQLTAPTTGTLPFTLGLGFKKGDIPGVPVLDVATSQVIVKARWNDGSVKHAIASGQVALNANAPLTIGVYSAASTPAGTNLTASDIQAANPQASVTLGAYGTVNLSPLLSAPFRTWISGPDMVEAHYRAPVGSDPSLVVWFYVRLYKGGKMWVRTVVENGYLDVTTADKTYVPSVSIDGSIVYNNSGAALTHYAHTRWTQEGWVGMSDPNVLPQLDTTYLKDAKLVPNYMVNTPSTTALNALYQNYVPYQHGGWTTTMGNTGFQEQIGLLPLWDSLYITSGADPRAYKSVIANAQALNSYPIVWNDSVTQLPTMPSNRPTWTAYGPNQGGGTDIGAGPLSWDGAHFGSGGYLAYLITGDYYYLETMEDQSATTYLMASSLNWGTNPPSNNFGTSRWFNGQTRGYAWDIRSLSQLVAIAPPDPIVNDYKSLLANNITHLKSLADGVNPPGIGYVYEYNLSAYGPPGVLAPWMQNFFTQSLGAGADLEPLANMNDFYAVRNYMERSAVGVLGDSSGFCFTQAYVYNLKASSGTDGNPNTWYKTWAQVYAGSFATPPACTNTLAGSSGGDPTDAAYGYWGNLLPAIAYAVEDGAPGASAAWSRLTGATNWSTVLNSGFDNTPNWGILPRVVSVQTPAPAPVPTPAQQTTPNTTSSPSPTPSPLPNPTPSPTPATSGGSGSSGGGSVIPVPGTSLSTPLPTLPMTTTGVVQSVFTTTLTLGSKGEHVYELQSFLITQKLLQPDALSGYYGPVTEKAVKAYQCREEIVCGGSPQTSGYGVVGVSTRKKLNAQYAPISVVISPTTPALLKMVHHFSRILSLGMKGDDVKLLQQFLNQHGFVITANGAGSPGKETTYFGVLTARALVRFQNKYAPDILFPAGLQKGTGVFGVFSRKKAEELWR